MEGLEIKNILTRLPTLPNRCSAYVLVLLLPHLVLSLGFTTVSLTYNNFYNFSTFLNVTFSKTGFLVSGESVVMASIYGPVEATLNKMTIDKASVDCYYRPKAGVPGNSAS